MRCVPLFTCLIAHSTTVAPAVSYRTTRSSIVMASTAQADRRAKRSRILAELDDIEDERTRIEQRQAEIVTALEELSTKRAESEVCKSYIASHQIRQS